MKLNITKELEKISNYIKALHHSDNNGEIDNNLPIKNDYWFLPHLKNYAVLPQVLEVKKSSISSIIDQLQLLEIYGN